MGYGSEFLDLPLSALVGNKSLALLVLTRYCPLEAKSDVLCIHVGFSCEVIHEWHGNHDLSSTRRVPLHPDGSDTGRLTGSSSQETFHLANGNVAAGWTGCSAGPNMTRPPLALQPPVSLEVPAPHLIRSADRRQRGSFGSLLETSSARSNSATIEFT